MTIDKNTVARIASLARIRLTEDEQNTMTKEFQGILSWVDQLQEVNTDDVPPLTSVVEITLPLREGNVTDGGVRVVLHLLAIDLELPQRLRPLRERRLQVTTRLTDADVKVA
ncbi:MAG: Asp-tRNA(Asn)/Glu-tRNA(Gln) amidotransferase subunit GatC, partial [Alphaproteobacteria bacterium]|nr:Asp-tRNA(Asn)/Glu-tRNA(Gln) amidotransferase subunit GatC [Alphaproteobacteria bacterium]